MHDDRKGQTAVIFLSRRTDADAQGYAAAAHAMEVLAAEQPGYRGMVSTRGEDGLGITISYWSDETSAIGWRDHGEHTRIRNRGRAVWYSHYDVIVCTVERAYAWTKA